MTSTAVPTPPVATTAPITNSPATSAVRQPERTIMLVWPSVAATEAGRLLGWLYQLGPRVSLLGLPFRPGWLLAVALLPVSLFLYFYKIVPRFPLLLVGPRNRGCRRYRLTTERVVIEHPFDALSSQRRKLAVQAEVHLAAFETIDIETRPGQAWYRAGDLVFRRQGNTMLRLPGVPHPEAFRRTCLKTHQAYRDVQALREQGLAV